jgi:hypothetical protein
MGNGFSVGGTENPIPFKCVIDDYAINAKAQELIKENKYDQSDYDDFKNMTKKACPILDGKTMCGTECCAPYCKKVYE